MRNKFPGVCYRCGQRVEAGDGHFERHDRGWRTQHATCAIEYRNRAQALADARQRETAAQKE